MRIGEVAAGAGVSVQAVRYYERRGLLPPPARRSSGYREYPSSAVRQLRTIKWAQGLGFRLGQVAEVVGIGHSHLRGRRTRVRALVRAKLTELDDTLRELESMRHALLAVAACRCDGACPIVKKTLGTPTTTSVRRSSRRPRWYRSSAT